MIVGQEKPDAGKLTVGETVVPSYVDQDRDRPDPSITVHDEISGGLDKMILGKREIPSRAYVSMYNFKGSDQQKRIGDLSGGEMNRLHLARTLKTGGNVLLLDEPTNDLDVDTLRALEEALLNFGGCAVVISARPLVPRPHRHAHPRLRGRQPDGLVRRATTRSTRPTGSDASAWTPTSRTGSSTSGWQRRKRYLRGRLG